ncbi:MAG: DUF2142 domain-containing protein, partial [Mycobacteriales bacterium]
MSRLSGVGQLRVVGGVPLFLRCLAAIAPLVALWSLATPLMAAPDEPAQFVEAAAVARGQLLPPTVLSAVGPQSAVRLPADLVATARLASCVAFHPDVPASCQPVVAGAPRIIGALTEFGRYPPPYYALVGLPTRWTHGRAAAWAARAAAGALTSVLLALGWWLAASFGSSGLLLGAAVALTPMVLFLGGVVNESNLEISAGFALWCGLLCLADGTGPPPARLVRWTAVAGCALAVARALSPFFLAVALVAAGLVAGGARLRELAASRVVRRASIAVVAAVVASLGWLLARGIPTLLGRAVRPPITLGGELARTAGLTGGRILQLVGNFGWLDTPAPLVTDVCWGVALGTVLVAALGRGLEPGLGRGRGRPVGLGRRRTVLVAVGVSLVVVGLPFALESPRIDAVGVYWQSRYVL